MPVPVQLWGWDSEILFGCMGCVRQCRSILRVQCWIGQKSVAFCRTCTERKDDAPDISVSAEVQECAATSTDLRGCLEQHEDACDCHF